MQDHQLTWLQGFVVHGDGRGRELGFPTANLVLSDPRQKPADGVYACLVKIPHETKLYKGMLHSGPRPTFVGAEPTIELHILEVENDVNLYGDVLSFTIVKRIRDIKKFNTVEALIDEIKSDAQLTFTALEKPPAF